MAKKKIKKAEKRTIASFNGVGKWAEFWFKEGTLPGKVIADGSFHQCCKWGTFSKCLTDAGLESELYNTGVVGCLTVWEQHQSGEWLLIAVESKHKVQA